MNTPETPTGPPIKGTIAPRPRRRLRRRQLGLIAASVTVAAVLVPASLASASSSKPVPHPTPTHQASHSAPHHPSVKPTIVLVHGAWADGSSWSGVTERLQRDGYTVDVAPNPLRGLAEDSAYLQDYLATVSGPIVLVGHSYGGAVITDAATGNTNVKALVYDDAFIPDAGQTVASLAGANSALAPATTNPTSVFSLVPYPGAPSGIYDTYLLPSVFLKDVAADLPPSEAAVLAASQSPASLLTVGEPSSAPAWKTIPSWDLVGLQDKIIPPAQQLTMAAHAHSHVTTINSSHLSLVSHPKQVTDLIITAANATS